MFNFPGIGVCRSIVRVNRVQHLRWCVALPDLRVVVGHGGGAVGNELVGWFGALDVAVVRSERGSAIIVLAVLVGAQG